jgi:hypothetical protein
MVATAITAATRREQAHHLLTTLGETSVGRPQLRQFERRVTCAGAKVGPGAA